MPYPLLDKQFIVLQKRLRLQLHQNPCQVNLKVAKHTNLQRTHAARHPEASPTANHTVAHEVEVIVSPGPDPVIGITSHPPTVDQTLTTLRKPAATLRTH